MNPSGRRKQQSRPAVHQGASQTHFCFSLCTPLWSFLGTMPQQFLPLLSGALHGLKPSTEFPAGMAILRWLLDAAAAPIATRGKLIPLCLFMELVLWGHMTPAAHLTPPAPTTLEEGEKPRCPNESSVPDTLYSLWGGEIDFWMQEVWERGITECLDPGGIIPNLDHRDIRAYTSYSINRISTILHLTAAGTQPSPSGQQQSRKTIGAWCPSSPS